MTSLLLLVQSEEKILIVGRNSMQDTSTYILLPFPHKRKRITSWCTVGQFAFFAFIKMAWTVVMVLHLHGNVPSSNLDVITNCICLQLHH